MLLVVVGAGCLGFFLLSSCCVSLAICSSMSSTVLHWSWLVRDFRLVRMGEYSCSNLLDLSLQYSLSFSVRINPAFWRESSHSIINVPGVSGILGVTFGINPLGGLLECMAACSGSVWWLALSIPLVSLERAFRCPCKELSNSTLTLLVKCRLDVLVVISCLSWLVDALLAIPLVPICMSFSFKFEVQSLLLFHCVRPKEM